MQDVREYLEKIARMTTKAKDLPPAFPKQLAMLEALAEQTDPRVVLAVRLPAGTTSVKNALRHGPFARHSGRRFNSAHEPSGSGDVLLGPLQVPTAFRRRLRRSVPEPELLRARVESVLNEFRGLACSRVGRFLLSPATENVIRLQMRHITAGCVSDFLPVEARRPLRRPLRGARNADARRSSYGFGSEPVTSVCTQLCASQAAFFPQPSAILKSRFALSNRVEFDSEKPPSLIRNREPPN